MTINQSEQKLMVVVPTAKSLSIENTEVVCAKGDITCKARVWNQGETQAEMQATCFVCDEGAKGALDGKCLASASDANAVMHYNKDVKFSFKQDGTKGTDVIKIEDVHHQPNSKGVVGRLFFKPSTSMKLYAGESVLQYKFGDQTFGDSAICQVFESATGGPGKAPSKLVNKCVVTGSTVDITMA